MNRRNLIILGWCFVFAVLVVVTLYAASYTIVHQPNSFLREYRKFAADKAGELDLTYNSFYIAGVTATHVYLGNVTAPFKMLVVNHALTDTQHVQLTLKNNANPWLYMRTMITVDSPYFYMADGVMPAVFRGTLGEWQAERITADSTYFTRMVPISATSFAIRTNSYPSLDNVLGKIQIDTPHVKLAHGLLERQVDGVFCTDGELFYNNDLNKLVYTYYYRNGYIVCDTNLNLEYRGHTLDTFRRAQIKVGYVKSDSSRKLTYKKYVNVRSHTSGNYLFIKSGLLAKNDPRNLFDKATVIDVYDLRRNVYAFSMILANYKEGTNLSNFRVFKNQELFAIYDQYLLRYTLEPSYFHEVMPAVTIKTDMVIR